MAALHISISAEPLAYIGNFAISNSIFTSLIVSAILIILAYTAKSTIKYTSKPTGLQNVLEALVEGLYSLTHGITHDKRKTAVIFPLAGSMFLFILLNNWLGLLPGVGTIGINYHPKPQTAQVQAQEDIQLEQVNDSVQESYALDSEQATIVESEDDSKSKATFIPILRAGSADLNTTIALALFSVTATQMIGVHFLGLSYFSKFFNVQSPIFFFVGFLELISEFAKIISFAFRLFGNIFAGEVLLAVIAYLLPPFAPIPFLVLEIMVGAIQALVFAMLSIVFMSMATQRHGDDH